jgi:hypothetical protein
MSRTRTFAVASASALLLALPALPTPPAGAAEDTNREAPVSSIDPAVTQPVLEQH